MREMIRRFRSFILLGGALFLLAAIAASVYVVQTKRTENRSKASTPINDILPRNDLELPIVEFGTIEKIMGVGALPQKSLAVLGEATESMKPPDDELQETTVAPILPPPPTPKYIFKTFDGRVYILQQPQFRCPKGENCIQLMPPELNFDQYLGTPVMIEGILIRSKCTYAPEATDYRCEQPTEPVYSEINWWPLPPQGIFEVRTVHNARIMGKDEVIQPFTGVLSFQTNYANENVYLINDFQKCRYPLCGPRFIRSATTNLSRFLNQSIQVNGPSYALGGDIFLDAVSVSTTGPTVTPPPPGCYYQQVECFKTPCDPILVCPSPTYGPPPPPPKPTLASCKRGDVNRDGTVDFTDLGALLVNFFKREPFLNPPSVDINGDGVVDISDYSLFAKDYGTSTGPCI